MFQIYSKLAFNKYNETTLAAIKDLESKIGMSPEQSLFKNCKVPQWALEPMAAEENKEIQNKINLELEKLGLGINCEVVTNEGPLITQNAGRVFELKSEYSESAKTDVTKSDSNAQMDKIIKKKKKRQRRNQKK